MGWLPKKGAKIPLPGNHRSSNLLPKRSGLIRGRQWLRLYYGDYEAVNQFCCFTSKHRSTNNFNKPIVYNFVHFYNLLFAKNYFFVTLNLKWHISPSFIKYVLPSNLIFPNSLAFDSEPERIKSLYPITSALIKPW